MPKATKNKKSKKNKQVKKKEVKKDTNTKKEDNATKHPGYCCLYLGDKELQGYGFKTGDGLLDVAPFKTLKKLDIIEEIKFKGKMCAFQPFHALIEKYENEDILFIWDPDEKKEKECNFYFCHTIETFQIEKERLGISDDGLAMNPEEIKRKKEEEEQQRKRLELEEELKREQLRIAQAIEKLKKPLIARPWKDLGSFDEIMNNKIKPTKVRNRIIISRKRKFFGLDYEFHDFDNNQNGMNLEIKSLKNGSTKYGFDVYRKLVDKNHQIGNPMIHKKTQTNWNRKINKIVQYEFNEESIKKHKEMATSTQTDDIADIIGFDDDLKLMEIAANDDKENNNDNNQEEDDMNERLANFLEDVYPEIQEMLTDNNLVNIFEDDFDVFKTNDNDNNLGLDTKTENIKEIQTFVDLNWSRGKKISDIQWMPSSSNDNKNMIAVSCIENMSFDDRVNIMNRSRKSTILLWNLSHILLKAQTVLTAPSDIFVFRFHPKNKNIIIGGLETGQVAIWDLSDYNNNKLIAKKDTKSVKNHNQETNTNEDDDENIEDINVDDPFKIFDNDDDDEDDKIPMIEPKMLSFIEKSHVKSVTDLLWLPEDIMIDSKTGELKYIDIRNRPNRSKVINEQQFMSISGDGTILFWDIQPPKQTEKEKKKNEPAKWIPIYMKKIERNALKDNIFLDKEAMDLAKYDSNSLNVEENENENEEKTEEIINDSAGSPSEIIFGSKFCYSPLCGKLVIGTELGEYCLYNFSKINKEFVEERGSLLSTKENNKTTTTHLLDKEDNDQLLQNTIIACSDIYKQHFNDIKSIQISPHFSDIYLSIGDWRFCIWRNDKLLFISSYSSSYITDGCWSPSRPAVIITAKYDGSIDIWDLLDQTHCAVFKNSPISSTSISSIIYDNSNKNNNILAVGDNDGNLRILQIPRNFVIPLNNEKLMMAQFYEKEYQRIKFINKRYNIHKLKTIDLEKQKEAKDKDQDKEEKEHEENNKDDQKQIDDKKLEEKYQNMLVSFKKQLGIKDGAK